MHSQISCGHVLEKVSALKAAGRRTGFQPTTSKQDFYNQLTVMKLRQEKSHGYMYRCVLECFDRGVYSVFTETLVLDGYLATL